MLYREPAVVAVPRIGVNAESEFLDIELDGFVLIANVHTDHLDTLAHGTSVSSAPSIPPVSCRRFSETAILRSGRRAALTKQAGTRSSSCGATFSRARSSPGLSPVTSRNVRPNVPKLFQPAWNA